jgi:hypothetical protein
LIRFRFTTNPPIQYKNDGQKNSKMKGVKKHILTSIAIKNSDSNYIFCKKYPKFQQLHLHYPQF